MGTLLLFDGEELFPFASTFHSSTFSMELMESSETSMTDCWNSLAVEEAEGPTEELLLCGMAPGVGVSGPMLMVAAPLAACPPMAEEGTGVCGPPPMVP